MLIVDEATISHWASVHVCTVCTSNCVCTVNLALSDNCATI